MTCPECASSVWLRLPLSSRKCKKKVAECGFLPFKKHNSAHIYSLPPLYQAQTNQISSSSFLGAGIGRKKPRHKREQQVPSPTFNNIRKPLEIHLQNYCMYSAT